MKITTLNKYKTKLIRTKLLKTKVYKNKKNLNHMLIKTMETRLKKALHVIYKFHVAGKKILFIGTPLHLDTTAKQLLKHKKHSFIPESVWMNGIITNSKASFTHLLKQHVGNNNKSLKFLFNLKNEVDLIVVLNERANLNALKESSLKRVPIIALDSTCDLTTYKVTGSYVFARKNIRNNLFFLLLSSLLKKAELLKKKHVQTSLKQKRLRTTKQL